MSPCNCGGSGQWKPPAEGHAEAVVATTGPAAPGYFAEPTQPRVWNGPKPTPAKP